MKKLMIMAALVLSSVCAMAQHEVGSFTLQPKVGINFANMTNMNKPSMRVGLAAGLEAEYYASDIVSVSLGAIYSMQGCKAKNEYVKETLKLDYINVPILANVYVVPGLAVKLGIQPGFCINKKIDVEISTGQEASGKLSKDGVKGFDLSIPVGISYEFANFQLDARYNFGLTKAINVEKDSPKNSVIQVTLGYKFQL
ncbi:MAG: PorT family protein [Prevotella sp.]|nr:PorT family protein [Prevotella sp.]